MNDALYEKYLDECAGDISLYSCCCGAHPFGEVYLVKNCDPTGICAKCRDHTSFEKMDDEGEPISNPKEREYTTDQWEIIEQLKQGWSEEA